MLKVTFFFILALFAMFAIGFLAIMAMFDLVYKSPELTRTRNTVKAVDILAREGYVGPPRTRRRRDLAHV